MKKILLSLVLLLSIKGFSQAITVNPNSHTPAQLVNNVLVNNACLVQISNISARTGTNFGSVNGIAHYQNTNPNFKATTSGVLLTTGQAILSPGPNTGTPLNGGNSSTAWTGDAGLEAALASAGITMISKNATVLEFDFVPNTSNFGFDFLFASEEYGAFQCESNDAFVVLLTQGATTQNMALIPSTNQPVTVSNIRNILYNSSCPSANASFFGAFNGGSSAAGSATNYNGQTVLMHASAAVTPNLPYHIRFVIADDGRADGTDGDYDSAVFLPAGSLNLGQKLFPQDLTVANGNALCFGQPHTLNTNLDPAVYEFSWTRNGGPSIGNGPSLPISQAGQYAVTISRADIGCITTQTITIEYTPEINAAAPNDLQKCDTGASAYTYNLGANTPVLKAGLNPATVVTYHATLLNANGDTGALSESYSSPSGVTIYARVETPNGCYTVKTFQLLTSPAPTATAPQNLILCESAQASNNAIFDLTQQTFPILNGQTAAVNEVRYFTSLPAANANTSAIETPESFTGTTQTIYARVQKIFDPTCYSVTQFNLTVKPLPVLPAEETVNSCNSYVLPALAQGGYYTGTGGTGTNVPAGTTITTSQILYRYAQSGGTPNCSNQSALNINILTAATAPDPVVKCQSYTLPALAIGEYRTAAGGLGTVIPAGTVITATQTIYFFIPSAASCTQNNNFTVTITSNPSVSDPADVNSCGPYTLPALPNGEKYFTGSDGTGTELIAGDIILASQTLYVYTSNPSNPACTAQNSFNVVVNNVNLTDPADVVNCGPYPLPAITVGKYYSGSGGTGTLYPPGTNIASSQTVYVYAVSPTDASCSDEESFTVTINTVPNLPVIANVTACTSYTLPALPIGNYFTGPNGTGNIVPAGTIITATQTVFAYAQSPEGCGRPRSFLVTIIDVAAVNPGPQTACVNYILPTITTAKYYTGPNGTGTQLNNGAVITTSQTIYIRAISTTSPVCAVEESFAVTIVPRPVVAPIANVTTCGSYILPALPQGNYYTGNLGTGTMYPPGTVITTSQIIRVFVPGTITNCGTQVNFSVNIVATDIAPADVIACGSYTLPALPSNTRKYFSGPAGTGTQRFAGEVITTSQTIYVYAAVTSGNNCSDNNSFDITITPATVVDQPVNVQSCVNYQLPALTNGKYYAQAGGPSPSNPEIAAGTLITSTRTMYIYNSGTGVNCTAEHSFLVQILDITVTDMPSVIVCDSYILPAIAVGNYYTGPGGTGTMLHEGDVISTTQTIYMYAQTTTPPICTDEEDFTVTIKPGPAIDNLGNVGSCGNYTLPVLTGGNYFTGPGGTGTALFAGQVISVSQQLYIYALSGGTPNCPSENPFSVIINPAAPDNVTVCDSYILPTLDVGNYFTGPAGTGTPKFAGDVITTTQDMYVYVQLTTTPNCTDTNKFTITVNHSPVLAPVGNITQCDSYQLPVLTVGNYYTQAGGQGTLIAGGTVLTTSQTVYVYAETATTPNCVSEAFFTVTINYTPLADARSDIPVCDIYNLEALIVGKYYAHSGGPGPGNPELPVGYPITATQTLYIYAETGTTPNCSTENSFLVEVFTIDVDQPSSVVRCDTYTLPTLNVGKYYPATGGPSSTNIEIPAGTAITASGVNTIYVYGETVGRLACPDEKSFTVTIFKTPIIDQSQGPMVAQCTPFALPAMAAGTVGQYYTGPGGTGTVLAPGTLISTPQTIYVYAASGPGALCPAEHSFFVDVNIVSVTAPPPITICGIYTLPPLATGNYYTGTGGTGTMLTAGTPITSTQTIYVYKQAGTTVVCSDEKSFVVTIITAPMANVPGDIRECGIDDLGHAIFDLTNALQQALGGQADTDVSVHETLAQAQAVNGVEVLSQTAYANIVAYDQTLYIRIYSTVSDCFSIVEFHLIVNPRPVATEPAAPYQICDGADGDGFAIFNLTTINSVVLGTLNPANFSVTYYNTEANADAGTNIGLITSAAAYNGTTESVFARVENNATGCEDVVEVKLIVNPLPIAVTPTPYSLCDINNPGDEKELFDLTTKIAEITQGALGVNVTFHLTNGGAIANTGAISSTDVLAYQNQNTVQTLFVRVTNAATGCYSIVLMDIRVEPLPALVMPAPAATTVCDPDGDGYAVFNLQALLTNMLNGAADLQVTFHQTAQNAADGILAIPAATLPAYTNDEPNDRLYLRAVNTTTGCVRFGTATPGDYNITLVVNPSPQIPALPVITLCDTDAVINGSTQVNLTQQNAVIQAALGTTVTIRYFTTLVAAQANTGWITNPAAYMGTDEQTIWVRVQDALGCFGIEEFKLNIGTPLALTTPAAYTVCNEALPNDNIGTFDLTTKDNEILGPFGVGQGFIVEYFSGAAMTPALLITNPTTYNNPAGVNPKTIYVRVTSPEGCMSYTTLTVRVLPLPVPDTTPDALELCDDNNSPDGQESFNLNMAEADIRDGDNTTLLTYYTTAALAEAGVAGTEILNPAAHISGTGIVYVRVEANTNNPANPKCYQVVELPLVVNPLPVLGDPATGVIAPYAICQVPFTGTATVLLNAHVNNILVGQDATQFTVKFYASQPAAIAGTPALPNQFTNASNPQTIWVSAENNTTGCIAISSFQFIVDPGAVANTPTTQLDTCDDDSTNDGMKQIDLTQLDAEVLGSQANPPFTIEYYETMQDAVDQTNIIATPGAYINTNQPDLVDIFIRVTNTASVTGCFDIEQITYVVERIPEPVIDGGGKTAVCKEFGTDIPLSGVVLTVTGVAGGPGFTYDWYRNGTLIPVPDNTIDNYAAADEGDYTVIVTSPFGCISLMSAKYTLIKSGPAVIPTGTKGYTVTNGFSENQVITVAVDGYGDYTYQLDEGAEQTSPIFSNVSPGMHIITVRDTNGCARLEIEEVSIIDYPNFFTPNGDGFNDNWVLFGLGDQSGNAKVYIFDRYGKLVKQISTGGTGWDGTLNGGQLPADDYWFTVKYQEPDANGVMIDKEFKSHFALKR